MRGLLTLDTAHVAWGLDPLVAYERLKAHIVHVSLSDFDGEEHRLPQVGHLAYRSMKCAMRKVIVFVFPLLTLLVLLGHEASPAASVLSQNRATSLPGPTTLIRLDPQIRQRYVAPPDAFLRSMASPEQETTATIVVNYLGTGWTAEARAAFEYAAGIWENLITSPVPIVVDAQFGPLGLGILGGAGPTQIWRDFPNAPQANTWYPVAAANKLANGDLDPAAADIQATLSSTYPDWYFGTGSSTPTDKISFTTVVLHELGHGLGFLGSMRVDDGIGDVECTGIPGLGCHGYNGFPMIYDRYAENGSGNALLNFPNNSAALAGQLTSNDVYFDSPGADFANGGSRVPLYAPAIWRQGSSYSHLAESYNSTPHALMTFSLSRGETIHNPGSVTLCMFEDMGWTVAESCAFTPISGLTAANDGPTVLGSATQLMATVTSGSNVTYEWDLGDGHSGSGPVISHQYAAPGSYTATVTATNSVSEESAATVVQVEAATTPITGLMAANDSPTVLGSATQLTATVTGGSNVTYNWDLGDGHSGSGPVILHQYATPGSYTATVTATNSVSEGSAATVVQVEAETTPITGLTAANDGPTVLGSATHLTATVTGGSNVTYNWDLGDGHSGSGPVISHQYAAPGSYTAVVTASNSVSEGPATTMVQVDSLIAGLTAGSSGPTVLGSTTQLAATVTGGSNVTYNWDLGDGNSASGPLISHQYAAPGSYTAVVTASNSVSEKSASTMVLVRGGSFRAYVPLVSKP